MKGASHCDSAIAKQQSKSSPAVVSSDVPLGRLALYLLSEWQGAGRYGLIFICADERRAEQLGAIVHAFDRQANVMVLPSLGSVPFDDVEPPPEILGRRSSVLRRLAGQDSALLIATAVSLSRRVPPPDAMRNSALRLACGGRFDEEHIRGFLAGGGYTLDERIDSPGMANFLGHALEIFAAGALGPVRIAYECGRITDIHTYDLTDQRDRDALDDVVIDVVRECDDGDSEASESSRRFATATVFEYRPSARLIADHGMDAHARRWFDRVAGDDASLFLTRKDWERCLADGDAVVLPATSSEPDLPTFYSDNSSTRSFRNFLGQKEKDGRRIIFAAATKRDLRAMDRRAGIDSTLCDSWSQAVNAPRRHPAALLADLDRGFESADGCVVVSAVDLFGSRATHQDIMSVGLRKNIGDRELSLGDVVIHLDRGMAILSELATVVTEGVPDAEMIRLEFADKDHILLPVSDLKAIWRYSSESDGIRLDKADGSSWLARRGQAEADIVATASHISERIAERRERRIAPIVPPAADYENFAAGFEYSITADQGRAIADVLSDLASHRPMDRLICGDVGYGKTEVALRATAATVLAGKQVAIVAPTTVLALQHLETFRRRFKPLGLVVGLLSRFTTTTDARATKKALADGSLSIVIGTHALAGKSVTFKNPGLLVIDEEQHLGQVQKAKLAALANELHVLTMTATPIPRTLNEVRAGLRALSIISTPPVRRMPVKTIVEPFNDAVVTSALRREHRRRGQSFLVCPRVQDIAPMAQKLQGLVPELKTIAVHGKMPAADIDKAMLTFAARGADILLATDIIESGLD
ncbi:MAG: transcription-repair coupling factor, partial [Tardiphaga sp.]|nr:transcription-repair coupling factor [Tardiphaga sp.]